MMNCIIVYEEPMVRNAFKKLIDKTENLKLLAIFDDTREATDFMMTNMVNVIFFDVQTLEANEIEFLKFIPEETFVIFISEFMFKNITFDMIDGNRLSVKPGRFQQALEKASLYSELQKKKYLSNVKSIQEDYFII